MHVSCKYVQTYIHFNRYSDFHNDWFFLAQKKTILIPNAENKDQSGALWLRNLNLTFFIEKQKDSHYGNQSILSRHCKPQMQYFYTYIFVTYT